MDGIKFISGLISLMGAGQGFLLAFLFVFVKRTKASKWMALFLLFYCCEFLNSYLISAEKYKEFPELLFLPINFFYAYMPALFIYKEAILNKQFVWTIKKMIWFVPAIIEFIVLFFLAVQSPEYKIELFESREFQFLYMMYRTGGILFSICIGWIGFYQLIQYQRKILDEYSSVKGMMLQWLKSLFIIVNGLLILWLLQFFLEGVWENKTQTVLYWFGQMLNVMIIFWVAYYGLRQNILFVPLSLPEKKESVLKSPAEEEQIRLHFETIHRMMEEKELYLNPTLRLAELAENTGLTNAEISLTIKSYQKTNFYNFVNKYRLDRFKKIVEENEFPSHSLLGIAYESGFNSKSTFNAYFKKEEGETPSDFVRKRADK